VLQAELRRLAEEVARLHEQRRNEHESVQPILRRLTEIDRLIRGGDLHMPPKATRRRPLGAS
jgi:hypothetical protein